MQDDSVPVIWVLKFPNNLYSDELVLYQTLVPIAHLLEDSAAIYLLPPVLQNNIANDQSFCKDTALT